MSLKFFHFLFIFVFMISIASAHEDTEAHQHPDFETIKQNITLMNSYLQENEVQIPGALNFLIKEGNIEVNVSRSDGTNEGFYITIAEEKISGISNGFPESSNFRIITSEETINNILTSQDVGGEIVNSYNNGSVEIMANGVGNKIKLFFGKIFLKIIA